ncbi:hypothetical protein D3C85_1145390 [compost metagenome]
MELYRPDFAVILLRHQRERQSLGQPSFSSAWRPLQDKVFLGSQPIEQNVDFGSSKEAPILEDVFNRVRDDWRRYLKSFTNRTHGYLLFSYIVFSIARGYKFIVRVLVCPGLQRQLWKAMDRISIFTESRTQIVNQL